MTTWHYKQFNDKVDHLSEAIKARKPHESVTVTTTLPENKYWDDVIKKTLDGREYDNSASKASLIYNIAETADATSETSAKASVPPAFSEIKVDSGCIKAISRLGKPNATNARPQLIDVPLNNVSDKRMILWNIKHLRRTKIFLKPRLLWKENLQEISYFELGYILANERLNKELLWIRNLKLHHNGTASEESKSFEEFLYEFKQSSSSNFWLPHKLYCCLLNARGLLSFG